MIYDYLKPLLRRSQPYSLTGISPEISTPSRYDLRLSTAA
jgi:hypothetical protein